MYSTYKQVDVNWHTACHTFERVQVTMAEINIKLCSQLEG